MAFGGAAGRRDAAATWPRRLSGPMLGLAIIGAMPAEAALAATGLSRGLVGAVETLDPQKAATTSETAILLDLFEGLVTRDAAGRLVPGAAESWTVSGDGLVYTFALRDGARWSNGDIVKAEDFVASFRRLFSPDTEATEDDLLLVIRGASAVKDGTAPPDTLGVTAIDAKTLEIALERPTPTFPARLALPAALPVNVTSIRRRNTDFETRIVSNGPYELSSVTRRDGYRLSANPRFRDADGLALSRITYRPFENAAACVDAYRAGEVQLCPDVPADHLTDLRAEFGEALRIAPYAGTYFYVFNTAAPPFDQADVRRALDLAVDRDALAAAAWSGGMLPAETLVPPALFGRSPPSPVPIADRRIEARKLLERAGYSPETPRGKKLEVEIRVGTGAAHEKTARLVAEDWRAVGVEATVLAEPSAEHFARLRDGGAFEVGRAGWIADEADPVDMLSLLHGDNSRFNYARYRNGEFDRLLDSAAAEADPAARMRELEQAEALLTRDRPVLPLLYYASLSLASPRLSGWEDNLLNLHPSRDLVLSD